METEAIDRRERESSAALPSAVAGLLGLAALVLPVATVDALGFDLASYTILELADSYWVERYGGRPSFVEAGAYAIGLGSLGAVVGGLTGREGLDRLGVVLVVGGTVAVVAGLWTFIDGGGGTPGLSTSLEPGAYVLVGAIVVGLWSVW